MQRTAVIFPGQGCQYVGMGKTLYQEFDITRPIFEEANDTLGFDLKKLCFEGNLIDLNKVENMLPAIMTVSRAMFKAYTQEIGIEPEFSAGHSLGEYTSLVCCGAINFADALKILRIRALLAKEVAERIPGTMTVVDRVNREIIETECKNISNKEQLVSVTCYNSPMQFVIAGHQEAVLKVEDRLIERDAIITPILTSPPFHSPLMEWAVTGLKKELNKYIYNPFKWPVISNVDALPYDRPDKITGNLTLQLTSPVKWQDTIEYLENQGITTIVELGPQAVLSSLIKLYVKTMAVFSYGQEEDRKSLRSKLNGFNKSEQDPQQHFTVVTRCLAIAVCTRNYNMNEDEYQQGVIEPYERIQNLQDELDKEKKLPTLEQMKEALDMLHSVFQTKKTPVDIQVRRFNQILTETKTGEQFPDLIR